MDSSLNDKIFLNIFKKREMQRTKNVKEKEERKTLYPFRLVKSAFSPFILEKDS